ncbi:30S ribosomal protein S3 [Methanocalculus taiwanensis]|uniref:Small ribosomal subunit protein uS3 n=1 Tax=Methanocalculus taiwanensis TaxID=106207 RepID=A0ABD4TN15_9EURY|nr:30S ribosomal protein S3 [Methanocalculus taiwanensis]MCQ1538685.1 30S ribosomal protein S3 [Methanocalculus taiwanensis]
MSGEKKFVSEGVRKVRVEAFLRKELKRAGYGGMDIFRTPIGTQVAIFAEKPGIVIGKGGKLVRQITADLANEYGIESPQVEVQQVENPNLNAQILAERLANALERGWYFRKAGTSVIRRVMESGALGCEVIIAGKLTGSRSRVQKFVEGYIKHSGEPAISIVETGYAVAIKKLGTIGVQVKIIPPGARIPDHFEIVPPAAPSEPKEINVLDVSDIGEDIDRELEAVISPEDEYEREDL